MDGRTGTDLVPDRSRRVGIDHRRDRLPFPDNSRVASDLHLTGSHFSLRPVCVGIEVTSAL
jgi:hypothetical protein